MCGFYDIGRCFISIAFSPSWPINKIQSQVHDNRANNATLVFLKEMRELTAI